MSSVTSDNASEPKHPALRGFAVGLWALAAVGGVIFNFSMAVRSLAATLVPTLEGLAWVGATLLLVAVLAAAFSAMFSLRHSGVALAASVLVSWAAVQVVVQVDHVPASAPMWLVACIEGVLVIVTLWYVLRRRSRGLLA